MGHLLVKAKQTPIEPGITFVNGLTRGSSQLEYIEFKVLDMKPNAKYREQLGKQECCIVVLTGKVNVSDHDTTFQNIGTRESVFEKTPTDSVYISNDRSFEVEAVTPARVAFCYSISERSLPTRLIKAADNGVEKGGF
ncbi:hypothetical protein GCM10025859_14100 [Alicyclobacillus fastidiosus]|nr:hypothetical protein GCM10025859_14100 [Alicyclobacillus fastidiosus]